MVITVEPGIYIPEEQIGIRIEDDVLVTPTGYRVLSLFPKELAEVEALVKR
jgi:Xaa-Pro aminopeptidase